MSFSRMIVITFFPCISVVSFPLRLQLFAVPSCSVKKLNAASPCSSKPEPRQRAVSFGQAIFPAMFGNHPGTGFE